MCKMCNAWTLSSKYTVCICDISCDICDQFKKHEKNARIMRQKSTNDKQLQIENNDIWVVSSDMQKIIQIPILKVKENYFINLNINLIFITKHSHN